MHVVASCTNEEVDLPKTEFSAQSTWWDDLQDGYMGPLFLGMPITSDPPKYLAKEPFSFEPA